MSLNKTDSWKTTLARIPYKVEGGKKYKIEVRYAQLNNLQANIEFNFGKEVDVDYTDLLKKHADVIGACVEENIYDRHLKRLFNL